jgi:capsular exopolysaccharide synthesis family protein
VEYSQSELLDSLAHANQQIQDRLNSLTKQRDSIAAPLTEIVSRLAANPTDPSLLEQQANLQASLKPELDALDNQRSLYVQAQESLALSSKLTPQAVGQVLTPATPPTDPTSPKPLRNGVVAFMFATGLGLVLALGREFLDNSIRTTEDLERAVKGKMPILGVIPDASAAEIAQVAVVGDRSAVSEAYRSLRTAIRFEGLDRPMKIIQVTSCSAAEGKTTTATNLARMLAQDGHRVAVVCCDLRRPAIHELFGVRVSPGLADVVLGTQALASAIQQVDSRTFVLPAGSAPPNPSELLGSSRAEAVVTALANEMDYVIIDTTPVLPVTDAIVVSRFADASILVVNAGDTTRNQLHQALSSLEQASAPLVGLVLNRAFANDRYGYGGYGYDYGYRPSSKGKGKKDKGRGKGKRSNGSGPNGDFALSGQDQPLSVR